MYTCHSLAGVSGGNIFPLFPRCVFFEATWSVQITMTAPRAKADSFPGHFLSTGLEGASLPVFLRAANLISGMNKSPRRLSRLMMGN